MRYLKKLMLATIAGCTLAMSPVSHAGYIGGEAGYHGATIGANLRTTDGSNVLTLGDEAVDSFVLPFAFTFYGKTYAAGQEGWVSTNGLLGFDMGNKDSHCCSMQSEAPLYSIQAGWFDLDAAVYMGIQGGAGKRELVFTWSGSEYNSGADNLFQAILHEGSNDIEFQVGVLNALNHDATVGGIRGGEDSTGLDFIHVSTAKLQDTGLLISAPENKVPEPASLALLGLGLAGVAAVSRRAKG